VPIEGEKLAQLMKEAQFNGMPRNVLDWDEVAGRVLKVYGE
jgi:hypothetical protein